MPYSKMSWKDRAVEFANRYKKSNETTTSVTLEQDPGIITEAGTPLNATNLNRLETQYDAAISEVDTRIQSLVNNAFNAYAPIDRYPAGISTFGLIGANSSGFPTYGTVQTLRGFGDSNVSFPRQLYMRTSTSIIQVRNPLATSKPAWAASTAYALNDLRMPTSTKENGIYYKCTTAGTSGATEPVWPTTIGATVADGTAVWTAEAKFWSDWVQLLDIPTADGRYVNVAGDTMTGPLKIEQTTSPFDQHFNTSAPQIIQSIYGVLGQGMATIGTRYSGSDLIMCHNAYQDQNGVDNWTQSFTTAKSVLLMLKYNDGLYYYEAPAGRASGTFSAFWGAGNKVWHAGNDGAGSTMDADTVDGIHGTALSKIASGSYTGDGTTGRVINVGFAPKFVVIQVGTIGTSYYDSRAQYTASHTIVRYRQQSDGNTYTNTFGDLLGLTGFTIPNASNNHLNNSSISNYNYIAWG
jgi:hypothetical protein